MLVPSFQFGGMEHPGSIFYNAASILLDESATENQMLGRASLIAHETAHMWFGDLVTMRWFNDVWMKEVFANFMAAKIVNPSFPKVNHELRFLVAHYPGAYSVDRTAGTHPIRQELANLNEAGSLYGAIIYQKAPIVMRQLERLLGADTAAGGPARVPEAIRVRECDLARSRARARRADRSRPRGLEPGLGRRGGPAHRSAPSWTSTRRAPSAGWRSFRAMRVKDRSLVWTQQIEVLLGLQDRRALRAARNAAASEPRCPMRRDCRAFASSCRLAAASPTAA